MRSAASRRAAYEKLTEQAAELVALLADEYPNRHFELAGDAAYTNSTLVKGRPDDVTLIGRGRLDAALYTPPPRRKNPELVSV